jgi:stage II sporulation protein R
MGKSKKRHGGVMQLTDEEYDIIVSASNDDDIPVKIKFKVVEFFQSSRIKFSGFINRIFRLGN